MKCVVCKKELRILHNDGNPATSCWHDGAVDNFIAGYGSKYDTTHFIVGICDDCLDDLVGCDII